jgi:hypothetical protein
VALGLPKLAVRPAIAPGDRPAGFDARPLFLDQTGIQSLNVRER